MCSAYSVNETNTLGFPAYKNLGFTIGTLDSYLNDPPFVAANQAKFIPVHHGPDLRYQVELLVRTDMICERWAGMPRGTSSRSRRAFFIVRITLVKR